MTAQPRGCTHTADLPIQLVLYALEITPDEQGSPLDVSTRLRCSLERHTTGPHVDLVRELDDATHGEIWARWEDDHTPDAVAILPDCPTHNGQPAGRNEGCELFEGHSGGHSHQFARTENEPLDAPTRRRSTP
ncbi:hypothetical protein [Streptomyces sp. NPDC020965]|uniref:hypothetical protein n=1 Tax=Streptomyces sp. NPDC020965 TaxID=3365105 RepID=UPI0037AC92A5